MTNVQATNMYDLLTRLRPQWLRATAAAGTGSRTLVFLDGTQLGDLDQLRQIPPSSIREARYYSASEAQARLAVRQASPVIALTSSR